jgi:hypothetical protein
LWPVSVSALYRIFSTGWPAIATSSTVGICVGRNHYCSCLSPGQCLRESALQYDCHCVYQGVPAVRPLTGLCLCVWRLFAAGDDRHPVLVSASPCTVIILLTWLENRFPSCLSVRLITGWRCPRAVLTLPASDWQWQPADLYCAQRLKLFFTDNQRACSAFSPMTAVPIFEQIENSVAHWILFLYFEFSGVIFAAVPAPGLT